MKIEKEGLPLKQKNYYDQAFNIIDDESGIGGYFFVYHKQRNFKFADLMDCRGYGAVCGGRADALSTGEI